MFKELYYFGHRLFCWVLIHERLRVDSCKGGSKGVPRKNLKPLCGHPLIRYTIETAKQSSLLSSIVVSTDDIEIAEVVTEYGCEVPFLRPAHLASDKATIIPVIKHAIGELEAVGRFFDAVFASTDQSFKNSFRYR